MLVGDVDEDDDNGCGSKQKPRGSLVTKQESKKNEEDGKIKNFLRPRPNLGQTSLHLFGE